MTLDELIRALNAAKEPDRELDAEIAVCIFGGEIVWKQSNYTMELYPVRRFASKAHVSGWAHEPVPLYTASVDAALGLISKSRYLRSLVALENSEMRPYAWRATITRDIWVFDASHTEKAIAICVAALKAGKP